MAYTSSPFIFMVLAGVLVAGFLPLRVRIFWLILLGLGWFSSWNMYLPVIIVPVIFIYHFFGIKKLLWPAVVFSVLLFLLFRSFETTLAVGCSFYLLILLGYTIDVSGRKSVPLKWEESLLMGSFFPLMMSGPVVRSEAFAASLREDRMSWDSFFDGALIFSVGFLKFSLLNEGLEDLSSYGRADKAVTGIILSSLIVTMKLYVTLSSFADMGRGVARAFGILVPPSFLPVIFARDPSDFWERWNRTVAGWFRDYLVFPSLLKWGRKVSSHVIVFGAFVILGIWHGLAPQWVIFGIFNGVMVIAGSVLRKKYGSNVGGRFLVFLLLFGNGFIHILFDVQKGTRSGAPVFEADRWFYIGIVFLMIVEWFQERTLENDFYLRFHPYLKKALVIGFFFLWVILGEHREPVDPETLPIYFDL